MYNIKKTDQLFDNICLAICSEIKQFKINWLTSRRQIDNKFNRNFKNNYFQVMKSCCYQSNDSGIYNANNK